MPEDNKPPRELFANAIVTAKLIDQDSRFRWISSSRSGETDIRYIRALSDKEVEALVDILMDYLGCDDLTEEESIDVQNIIKKHMEGKA